MYTNKIKALKEIRKALADNYGFIEGTRIDILSDVNSKIALCELLDDFGFKDDRLSNLHFSGSYLELGTGGCHGYEFLISLDGVDRAISWPDCGSQPSGWFYKIGFSTGAYIFGKHYPTKLFQDFFFELKALNPAYCDSANKGLYFTKENAKNARDSFHKILEKYKALVESDKEEEEIKALELKLAKLKGEK